ncbi:AbrB/MazE/SpoVT family DNA-binding domain-containing protein [Nitratifractor sp.]
MTSRIGKWGNSAALRLPKELLEHFALGVGDRVEIVEEEWCIVIRPLKEKKRRLVEEARRISDHAKREYSEMEGTIGDGL